MGLWRRLLETMCHCSVLSFLCDVVSKLEKSTPHFCSTALSVFPLGRDHVTDGDHEDLEEAGLVGQQGAPLLILNRQQHRRASVTSTD